MASPNVGELLTATIENRSGKLGDSVSKNIPFYKEMKKRGKIVTKSGGTSIRKEIQFAENGTYTRYTGAEPLNIAQNQVIDSFDFAWKQCSVAVTINGAESLQNQGKEQIIDLLSSRIDNAMTTFSNKMEQDLFSDGTADSGKQIGGLQLLIADNPTTGTVGGVNRASYTFARNFKYSGVTDGTGAVSSSNIKKYIDTIMVNTIRGADSATVGFASNDYYLLLSEALSSIQRITSADYEAGSAKVAINYNGIDIYPAGYGNLVPAAHLYLLNLNHLELEVMKGRNMQPIDPATRASVNQDSVTKLIGWMGNLVTDCFFTHGVLIA